MSYPLNSKDGKSFLIKSYSKLKDGILEKREHEETDLTERNEFHRDFTRILYAPSFRRLQGKMQILGIQNDAFFRNRLTHSLEVSQIARSIASQIGQILGDGAYSSETDLYVIEAAALAHDIGHPAFGHSGERILNKICTENNITGGFEGNAQNFRVLRHIEKKLPNAKGLNLTNRTLLAVNKYLVSRKENPEAEKFIYQDDYDYLQTIRTKVQLENERTLDVQIIDIADEIAYAVHDLEDALTFGYFNIDEILFLMKEAQCYQNLNGFVEDAKKKAMEACTYNTTQEYSQIFRRKLVSKLTNTFINDIGVVKIDENYRTEHGITSSNELGFMNYGSLVHGLKKVIFEALCRHDEINIYEQRGACVIRRLFDLYNDPSNKLLLTPDYRSEKTENKDERKRCIIDFIAGMMDDYAKSMYKRYTNICFDEIPIPYTPQERN